MRIPAVCDNCGSIFPSNIDLENSSDISFSGCVYGPCPVCGKKGHILDGTYTTIGSILKIISGSPRTVAELERLTAILKKAREDPASLEEVKNAIESEVPELSSLKDILPQSRNQLYAFISMLLSTIALVSACLSSGKDPQNITVNNVVNNIYQQLPPKAESPITKKHNKAIPHIRKVGRNEPCPCGSGKKHKKCCLDKK